MASNEIQITMVLEEDLIYGPRIVHLFPSHEAHEALMGCDCHPEFVRAYISEYGSVEVWAHWRRDENA